MTWNLALVVAGHALSFAGFSALFALVALGRKSSPHRLWILVASAGTAVWAAGTIAAAFLVAQPVVVPILEWPRMAGWLWLTLMLLATAAPQRAKAYKRLGVLGIGLPLAAIAVFSLAGMLGLSAADTNKLAHTGEAIALVGMIVFGLALLETLARWMGSRGRTAATYFFVGIGALLAIDLFLYATILLLGHVDTSIYQARGFISMLAPPMIALALAREREWLVDIHLSRQVIVNAATLMGVGIYLLAMALVGFAVRELDAAWGPALHITFLAGALILLISILASEGFRPRVNALVSRHFFSAKYDYRNEWLRFSSALSLDASKAPVEERLLNAILESVACRSGGLWLRVDEERGFVIAAARPAELLLREEPCSALAALMEERDGPASIVANEATRMAFDELSRLGALGRPWAAVPLRQRGRLIGFLILADSMVSRSLDAEDREFLQALCVQASSHLTEERSAISLDRARRFEASARQLTYIGHDLKNIVSQLSMVLQNWSRHKSNAAFLAELPTVLGTAVQRMKSLLEGLKTGGSTSQEASSAIDIRQCLAGLVPLWRARYERLIIDAGTERALVHGRRDHLQSIFDQLVCNAIEASDGNHDVTFTMRLENGHLNVEVTDRGGGIAERTVADSRFSSSESNKAGGFGVGLFQIREYVRRFGGSLSFISQTGVGTTATLTLPAEEMHTDESALEDQSDIVPLAYPGALSDKKVAAVR